MNEIDKAFFLRIGGSPEKQYIEKAGTLFPGLFVRANYFESSPGMLSGMCLRLASLKKGYIIDPVTYVFAFDPYNEWSIRSWQKVNRDKAGEKLRTDLRISNDESILGDWIRPISSPTKKQENKVEVLSIMRAYRKLADKYFVETLANEVGKRAIGPSDFNNVNKIDNLVGKVIDYQNKAIRSYYDATKYQDFKSGIPQPMMVLSPYFIINDQEWLNLMTKIWKSFDSQYKSSNGAAVVLCSIEYLKNNMEVLIDAISKTKINNVFMWIGDFKEEDAEKRSLQSYTKFIFELSLKGKKVINLYAGGLSPFLFPFGLSGMVNNPGYGMDKSFEPVKGGFPTAKYYIPTRHTRQAVLASYDLLIKKGIGISMENFIKEVCACPICKDGIKKEIHDMITYYGELGSAKVGKDGIKRSSPSQKAKERCAYHFIFSRLIEYRWALTATKKDAINRLQSEIKIWGDDGSHLVKWKDVLEELT